MTEHADGGGASEADDRPDLSGPHPSRVFGQLFDRHSRPLHRYLARRVGDLADDLVGETFLVAYQSRSGYDPGRGTARAWLYGIATNLLRRHLRQEERGLRAAVRAAGSTAGHEDHESRVADQVDATARARLLAGALVELDAGDRDVLLLTSWAGLDSNEVAEALDIPVGTVRSRLHRVRRRLRAHASNNEHTGSGDE
ncbi:sigma-70 family RNA polymerase sigma factor [Actinosynnema sp. NPDC023658]|uniref:RNA polymerase sigma factor n=1 Tax=Actinosynnema sp. NPDC023658 TaxID=3155465 RepID=UPI0033C374E6